MYGLLLEAIVDFIRLTHGEDVWQEIRQKAEIEQHTFSTHGVYNENLIPTMAKVTSEITSVPYDEIMDGFGAWFVAFVGQYGYDRILKVLGRHMRDFLNGLDNLHEYLRFSYPKMKAPSFFCANETRSGLTLHYRSRRKGFVHYVKGQIKQVGKMFYNTKVDIDVLEEHISDDMTHVVMRLHFDNTAFVEPETTSNNFRQCLPVRSDVFFEVFPFNIVFNRDMVIRNIGSGLSAVMSDVEGKDLTNVFNLKRPLLEFTWERVLMHTNNVFELVSKYHLRTAPVIILGGSPEKEKGSIDERKSFEDRVSKGSDDSQSKPRLHLKGQMMYMEEWDSMMFLGTPIMSSVDAMFTTGLYINDLSMHDSSRDLVLAGTQQSAELKLALDQEQEKSRILEESMKKLDSEMKRTDSLLYQMIPKAVADRLRKGEPAMKTCEVFESVTILFSDVVGFTTICSQITPLGVVSMLNAMYTKFDQLSESHNVYKVETIGDAYMVVSGAPTVTRYHALHICNMALDMLDSMEDLKDPSSGGNMKIRVGIHTGTAVAGVVGLKMPRYCLFGDTVNTASRMETNGEAMKIHVSETTRQELIRYPYILEERGSITVKGKGTMRTYYLLGKENGGVSMQCPFSAIMQEEISKSQEFHKDHVNIHFKDGESRSLYSPVTFDEIARSVNNTKHNTPERTPSKTTLFAWQGTGETTPYTQEELLSLPLAAVMSTNNYDQTSANISTDFKNSPIRVNPEINNSPAKVNANLKSPKIVVGARLEHSGERIHNQLDGRGSKTLGESSKPLSKTCSIL